MDNASAHFYEKCSLRSLMTFCSLDYIYEPQYVFTAHITQKPLNRVQAYQVPQGLRQDFIFRVPAPSHMAPDLPHHQTFHIAIPPT